MEKIHYTIIDSRFFIFGGDKMRSIKNVVTMDNYRLKVILDNGNSVTLSFESRIETVRFGMLADKAFFEEATTDGSYIRWDNKLEISVSEVFQLAQK